MEPKEMNKLQLVLLSAFGGMLLMMIVSGVVGMLTFSEHTSLQPESIKLDDPQYDYKIDLKQDYMIVYSKGGNVDTIPYSIDYPSAPIEGFFQRDNQ